MSSFQENKGIYKSLLLLVLGDSLEIWPRFMNEYCFSVPLSLPHYPFISFSFVLWKWMINIWEEKATILVKKKKSTQCAQETLVLVLTLLLIGCVTLGKSFYLSEPPLLILQNEGVRPCNSTIWWFQLLTKLFIFEVKGWRVSTSIVSDGSFFFFCLHWVLVAAYGI